MLYFIESILPVCCAILSLALFTKQTRKLCYAVASLAVMAELIPLSINISALFACSACLLGMITIDILQAQHVLKLSSLIVRRR